MNLESVQMREFLHACAVGDTTARRQFQNQYGEAIYHFPVKIYGAPLEEAGDYYLYVFDQDRIFLRLKTFDGRKNIQFHTFLSYYVLKHLFLDWRRARKEIDTVSLQTPLADGSDGAKTLEDFLPDMETSISMSGDAPLAEETRSFFNVLAPEDRLLLKLFSLADSSLSPEEVRFLAAMSERTVHETLLLLAEVHDGFKPKDEQVARLRDELDSVWGWIVLRQKELQTIRLQARMFSTMENVVDMKRLRARKQALEHALAKRMRQHEQLLEGLRAYKLTTPYKDIARLLNSTTCAISSRLFRLREQAARFFDEQGFRTGYVH